VTLNLTEMGVITEPYPLKITSNGNRSRIEIAGFFNEPVIIGTKVKIKSLLFHLTNIPFFTAHACSQREDDPGLGLGFRHLVWAVCLQNRSVADSAGNNEQRTRYERTA
jgi:hypothetical protein